MAISTSSVYSDIEKKLTAFLKAEVTDPKSVSRPSNSPFVVIGSELQVSQYFPHIIVQCVDLRGRMFAMGSKGQVVYPVVQFSVYSSSKKQLNEIKDEIFYDMASGRTTIRGYGLDRMEPEGSGYLPYNRELKVHSFYIRYSFVYHHLPIT